MAIDQIATRNPDGSFTNLFPLEINKGGTGSTNAAQARNNLGITPSNIGAANANHSHSWGSISGKPSSFNPSGHNHDAGNITSGVLPVNRGGTGATWGKQACWNIGAVHTENNLPMVAIRGMTVVALNPDKTQNILSFSRLTELCGFYVGRYNCALVGTTSDYAACPTVYGSYCSTDSIGIKCQEGNQVRVNYVILCWRE